MLSRLLLPALGKRKLADVTRADVARLHHELRATPTQANRVLSLLSRMMNLAENMGAATGRIEVDPIGGTTGASLLIGRLAGSDLLDHATRGVCGCRGGHVGEAAASSKRSVMSTALPATVPVMASRHTAIGVWPPSV